MLKKDKQLKDGESIVVEIAPADIDHFNKLIEGYDNLALVTTLDAKLGKVVLWVTKYTKKEILSILSCFPIPLRLVNAE